jgi:hypothetical protein
LVNGKDIVSKVLPADRITGTSILHISDPWYEPADALISNIMMLPFLSIEADLLPTPTQLAPNQLGKVIIRADFSLSFDLLPNEVISKTGSILHFSNNGHDGSRMPGIWFRLGGNTELRIHFSGFGYYNEGSPFQQVLHPTSK